MIMGLPPGLDYLFQDLPRIALPPAFTYIACQVARSQLQLWIPTFAIVPLCFLSLPVTLAASIVYRDWKDERDAAALGAILPPRVHGGTAGISLLKDLVENFTNGNPGEVFTEWAQTYGHTFNAKILFENRIFTTEPEYIKRILATSFDSFEKGPVFLYQFKTLLGTGVFNADGEMWKFHRSMTKPFFKKDRITHFDIFERHSDDAIELIKQRLREGYPVDIQDVASRFTLDSASEFLFGNDLRSLSAGLSYPHYAPASLSADTHSHPSNLFAKSFQESQRVTSLRSRYGKNWPLAEFWKDKMTEPIKIVRAYIDPIVAQAVAKKKLEREKGFGNGGPALDDKTDWDREVAEGETLLDHLVNYTYDEQVLRDEILNITVAARDTAITLSFCTYMLAEHPHVLRRLRQEILDKIGSRNVPTSDDIKDLKYLRAVLNETLRLFPAVPFNVRTSKKATVWPGLNGGKPIYVPAHTRTQYSVFMEHRRTDLWGPDALEFDPDRFLDERAKKYLTLNPFIFLPFNAGPRICLGQQFAYHEASFFIIRLLQNFSSFSFSDKAQPASSRPPPSRGVVKLREDKIWPKLHLTMYAMDGIWLDMVEANVESETSV